MNVRVQFDNQAGHPYGQKCRPPFIVPLPGHPDAMHDATRDARARKASYHKTNPYDDPKFASQALYLSANNFADGFVPFIARVISSCVTRFSPINF